MSWKHVLVIVLALSAPVVCGMAPACGKSADNVNTLSNVTIGGVLGHAGRGVRRRRQKKVP